MNDLSIDQYAVAVERLADIENFDALAQEHWRDFNNREPKFDKSILSLGRAVVVRHNSVAVGYIVFTVHKNPFYEGEKWCNVGMYYLQKPHRNQGIGADMFYTLETYAKEQNCTGIISSFNLKQSLEGFYKKLGFSATHTGLTKDF
jgi:GNAT superfamily N-acetyltransferase